MTEKMFKTIKISPNVMKRINEKRNRFRAKLPSTFVSVNRAPISFDTAMNLLYIVGKGFITNEDSTDEKWRRELAEEYRSQMKAKIQELTDIHESILEDKELTDEERQEICSSIECDINYLHFLLTLSDAVRESLSGLKKRSAKDIEFEMDMRDQRVRHLDSQKNLLSIPKIAGFLGITPAAVLLSINSFLKAIEDAANTLHAMLAAAVPILFGGLAVFLNRLWDNLIERKKDKTQREAERRREEIDEKKMEDTKEVLAISELRLIGRAAILGYVEDLREIVPDEFLNLVEKKQYNKINLIIEEAATIIKTGHLLPQEDTDEIKKIERIAIQLAVRVTNQSVKLHKKCSEYLARYCMGESEMTIHD